MLLSFWAFVPILFECPFTDLSGFPNMLFVALFVIKANMTQAYFKERYNFQ
jgi:hypothetical protein